MLLIVCGPSGVGKSTVLAVLAGRLGWKRIPTYMTRSPRHGETEKVQVPLDVLNVRENFLCINEHFGNKYGTMKADIEHATTSQEVWMLDFALENRNALLKSIPHLCVILVPENEAQLVRQLESSGRSERLHEVLESLRNTYSGFRPGLISNEEVVVYNYDGRLEETANQIKHFVLRLGLIR